ncbi:MAG: hypothetical protein IJ693_04265 [Bacteroidaceae bacterium]|nr:hypothetical protein [Bacteroidaceae bacterium]
MTNNQNLDELNRLVRLISDDNELLSRANTFMKSLVDNKKDITVQLEELERTHKPEGKHQ